MSDLARYNDESFDEKRIWVSRLLAQFIMDNVVIISIDESGFQSGYGPGMKWQPQYQILKSYDSKQQIKTELKTQPHNHSVNCNADPDVYQDLRVVQSQNRDI